MRWFAILAGTVLAFGLACGGPREEPPIQGIDDQTTQEPEIPAERVEADDTCVRYCEALAACAAADERCVDQCSALAETEAGLEQIACVMDEEDCAARTACLEPE